MPVETYDEIGAGYVRTRRTDPRHAGAIADALGGARTVVNVGAGAGSYEPRDRLVTAVEPSRTMIDQRPQGSAPVVQAGAEALPFADRTFDAGLAVLTVHHWRDPAAGLHELRRVVRGPVVVFTADIEVWARMWLVRDYLPEIAELDRARFVTPGQVAEALGGGRIQPLLTPADCADGFGPAFWRRPQAYLDPGVRAGISSLVALDEETRSGGLAMLAEDLGSGRWAERNAELLGLDAFDAGHRLVVADATR
jgi:SAM-dependent methyltransferase